MQYKALILTALLVLTSTPTFAATFADVPNVDKPQFVAVDDYDGYRHNRRHGYDDDNGYGHNRRHDDDNGYGHNRRHGYDD